MDEHQPGTVTDLLNAWSEGRTDAEEALLEGVYTELRQLAQSYLRKERQDHTLQATELINEAYLRVVDPGCKFAEPSMGRVITAPEVRGTGLGRTLVAEGLARSDAAWPGRGHRISAQAHLQRFYGGFGFTTVGEPYAEDDIPHVEMLR